MLKKILRDVGSYLFGNDDFSLLDPDCCNAFYYPIDLEFSLKDEPYFYGRMGAAGFHETFLNAEGWHQVPSGVASYGLANYNVYLKTHDPAARRAFLKCADWFMQDGSGWWRHDFDLGPMKAPWYSCLAQGLGISLLVRAYRDTNLNDYIDQAKRAGELFVLSVEDGGVLSELSDGSSFLEEYPCKAPKHVLNGFLSALIGIHDLTRTVKNSPLEPHLNRFVDALEANTALWDAGKWSTYDADVYKGVFRNYSTVSYHRLHSSQLRYIGCVCQRSALRSVADRWERHCLSFKSRITALAGKMAYRLLVR